MEKPCYNKLLQTLLAISSVAILTACESSECRLAKERETAAKLAETEAEMKLEGTAIRREIKIEINKEHEAAGRSWRVPVPPPVKPYPGQQEREARLLEDKVFATSDRNQAEKLRIQVCKPSWLAQS